MSEQEAMQPPRTPPSALRARSFVMRPSAIVRDSMARFLVVVLLVFLSGCAGSTQGTSVNNPASEDLELAPVASTTSESSTSSSSTTSTASQPSNSSTPTFAPKPTSNQTLGNQSAREPQSWSLERDGWASLETAVLRPGSRIGKTNDPTCTGNFLFTNPEGTKAYMGTAAHCYDAGPSNDPNCGDEYTPITKDSIAYAILYDNTTPVIPTATDVVADIGRFVYSSFNAMQEAGEDRHIWCAWSDFALIELNANATRVANPTMWHYGGPTQLRTSEVANGEIVHTYGGTTLRNHPAGATRPRDGIVTPDERILANVGNDIVFHAVVPGGCIGGDSGSPMIDADGQAIGVVTRSIAGASPSCLAAYLTPMLDYMAAHGGPEVILATADMLPHVP